MFLAAYFTLIAKSKMIFFIISFLILAIYSYKKDIKSHKAHYKNAAKNLLIFGSITLIIFVAIRLFTGN